MRFKVHLLMIRLSLLIFIILGLAGCSQTTDGISAQTGAPLAVPIRPVEPITIKEEPAQKLTIDVTANANINPDINNRPSPLNIRIYQLSNSNVFNNSGFYELFTKDNEYLMRDMVKSKNEFMIAPGSSLKGQRIVMDKQTQFIAVFAAFQKAEQSKAKLLFEVDSKVPIQLCLLVDGATIKQNECS